MFRQLITSQGLPAEGAQIYSTQAGTFSFTVPDGVTALSAVLIGGGGGSSANAFGGPEGGAGGTLVYATLLVTPGETLSITVGDGGTAGSYSVGGYQGGNGGSSTLSRGGVILLRAPGGKGGNNGVTLDSVIIDSEAYRSASNAGGAGGLASSHPQNREGNGGGGAGG